MEWKKEANKLNIPREIQRKFSFINVEEQEKLLAYWRKKRSDEEQEARESSIPFTEDDWDIDDEDEEEAEIIKSGETEEKAQEWTGSTVALESVDKLSRKQDIPQIVLQQSAREGINTVYIMTIFDGTLSFSAIFPRIYSVYEEFIQRILELKRELPDVIVKYGLLVFGAEGEATRQTEFGDSYFTADEEKLLEAIRNIRFQGGSPNGKEDVNGAIREGIRILEIESKEFSNLGLVLFTDSLPEDLWPEFDKIQVERKPHRGLRFANVYSYSDRYIPTFKIVDRDGNITEGEKNEGGQITGIEELLKPDGNEIMKQTVSEVMRQASVIR